MAVIRCTLLPRRSIQGRGNSGVLIMGRYELQVLDSFDNLTYPDGQASAVYGQYPPQANASRKPGEWRVRGSRGPRDTYG